ncbi:MAG: hypothetical protein ABL921_12010 [Pirellula sp.]
MLPSQTIKKLFRECFAIPNSDAHGISVSRAKQRVWLIEYSKELERHARVKCKISESHRSNESISSIDLVITESEPSSDWRSGDKFEISLISIPGGEEMLVISDRAYRSWNCETKLIIHETAQVDRLIERVIELQERSLLRRKKTEKLVNLRTQSLDARMRELGQEKQFAYILSSSTRNVELWIRFPDRKLSTHFAFPKGQLEAMLDELPSMIDTIQKLHEFRISFRSAYDVRGTWIEP